MSRWYDTLPVFAQNLVCDAYGLKMRRERFGSRFETRLEELLRSEWWPADRIAAYQDTCVREIVQHAYAHVPFYRGRMAAVGVRPQDIRGVADLPKLPMITKSDIREHSAQMRAGNVPLAATIEMHTSGTTGTALTFEVDREALPFRWAIWWRHRVRFGIRPGEWHVNFTGKPVVPQGTRRPPYWRRSRPLRQVLVNMQQVTPATITSLVHDLDELGARFWSGYPSIIHVYCRLAAEAGLRFRNPPEYIFTGAENILDAQRRDIESITGATLTDQYGFTEGAGNASQCEHFLYHEDFEYGVLECVDPEPQDSGEIRGRIVATGFSSRGFPLLRYEVGDVGVWTPASFRCSCGRASRALTRIEGRMDDYVITPEGRRLMRFDYLFKDTNAVREAQVVQERLGEIIIRLVVDESDAPAEVERLRGLVRDWISPTIDVRFDIVRELERARNGKLRAVVSRLSPAQREGRAGA